MPIIKPLSELENSDEISELAHKVREPIFLTKNGEGDLVVMSLSYFREMQLKIDLYGKLAAAESEIKAGGAGTPLKKVIQNARKTIHATK